MSILKLRATLIVFCLTSAVGVLVNAGAAEPAADDTVAELTTMLHEFLANSSTAKAHAKFWADDLVYTSSNGTRFGKAEIMQGFATAEDDPEDDNKSAPNVVYSGEDVNVQLFGSTAVVSFRLVGTADDGTAPLQYFNTGTFLERDGEWRVVAWQATVIPAAQGAE